MILMSWDGHNINDGTNYESILDASVYGLPSINPKLALRQGAWPLIAGVERPGKIINFEIYIRGSSVGTLQTQLSQWFDPDDETPKKLLAQDYPGLGGNIRYIYGICQALEEVPFSAGLRFVVTIQVHGDVFWRANTGSQTVWNITATGQTKNVLVYKEMDVYPVLTIEPTSAKSASWPYKRFVSVKWRGSGAASNYPVDIVNASLDTQIASTNFALASGDDLRVWVDGFEVNRYFYNINTANTMVWVNLDWAADVPMTLAANIGTGDTELFVNEPINNLPASGLLYVGYGEIITYSSKSNSERKLSGLQRGLNGTVASTATAGQNVEWLQHDIWILYGNASAGAGPAPVDNQPIITLGTSSNTQWDYDFPWHDAYPDRSAMWTKAALTGNPDIYGGNHGAAADPAAEMGIHIDEQFDGAIVYLTNPCIITNANFQNGEKYAESYASYWPFAQIRSGLSVGIPTVNEYDVPAPTANSTWQSWSQNQALDTGSKSVGLYFSVAGMAYLTPLHSYLEASDVTLTLDSNYSPYTLVHPELNNYSLDCTITNQTTGEAIKLILSMAPNEELVLDTDNKTVVYLLDESNQFKALTVVDGPRRDWLPLIPGTNVLRFDDVGTNGVTVTIDHVERFFN